MTAQKASLILGMSKVKKAFFCQKCGSQHAKWQGQCTSCKSWNTITEELVQKPDKKDFVIIGSFAFQNKSIFLNMTNNLIKSKQKIPLESNGYHGTH